MYVRLYHRVDEKTASIRFSVNDAYFANAESLDGELLATVTGDEFIRRFQGFSDLIRANLALDHP
jgi:hypothetical protein